MPSTSHGRCKVCRKVIHARHRFGMCKQCSDKHYARLSAERKAAKERRRIKALTTTVLEEGPDMTEQAATPDKPGRRPRHPLTDEEQVQILDAYTQTSEPVKELSARFGIKDTYIYNILDRVGVTWRRGNPESFGRWQENQARNQEGEAEQAAIDHVPAPVEKALENMLKLPPRPEPVAPTPAVERRVRISADTEMWAITVQGVVLIEAVELEDAIAQVRRTQPGLRIMKVELSQ